MVKVKAKHGKWNFITYPVTSRKFAWALRGFSSQAGAWELGVITPLRDEVLTLEERLARFDPERHGGELMIT